MSDISNPISAQTMASYLNINIEENKYIIGHTKFEHEATPAFLLDCTNNILEIFGKIEERINECGNITLDKPFSEKQLKLLAKWGQRVYQRLFDKDNTDNKNAQNVLHGRFQMMGPERPTPTFFSRTVSFPWEVLYENDANNLDWQKFWGLGYRPARILDTRDVWEYAREQRQPLDMLFCLHHALRHTHQQEWPGIEQMVKTTTQGHFYILGTQMNVQPINTGEELFTYFGTANHNMLHFACHCEQRNQGADVLHLSFLSEEGIEVDALEIELSTYTFLDVKNRFNGFTRQPLIFLNACHTGGGSDPLRSSFNLPKEFIKSGAAAVIATACAVPDKFAAEFARQFYQFFLKEQMPIGEALRATRWYFLQYHNNPLGLAYGLYSPAHYRLARPLLGSVAL